MKNPLQIEAIRIIYTIMYMYMYTHTKTYLIVTLHIVTSES